MMDESLHQLIRWRLGLTVDRNDADMLLQWKDSFYAADFEPRVKEAALRIAERLFDENIFYVYFTERDDFRTVFERLTKTEQVQIIKKLLYKKLEIPVGKQDMHELFERNFGIYSKLQSFLREHPFETSEYVKDAIAAMTLRSMRTQTPTTTTQVQSPRTTNTQTNSPSAPTKPRPVDNARAPASAPPQASAPRTPTSTSSHSSAHTPINPARTTMPSTPPSQPTAAPRPSSATHSPQRPAASVGSGNNPSAPVRHRPTLPPVTAVTHPPTAAPPQRPAQPSAPTVPQRPTLPPVTPVAPAPSANPTPIAPLAAPPAAAGWKDLPLPEDQPDWHSASDCRALKSPSNMAVIGARVRGKKHKHEGTHCDDWFEFDSSGDWTILAVADGAGSKKFSRVGSEAACKTSVRFLKEKLADHKIKERTVWNEEAFQGADLTLVRELIVEAIQAGWQAVVEAADQRATSEEHTRILGRPVGPSDLSTTLLLAVHTTVMRDGAETNLVFGCSVGDGMIAGIGTKGEPKLLMTADSGEHSGETRFLDERETSPDKLTARVCFLMGGLRALLLMTDGVADDYFPNDPGMAALYGDLLLNGIITSKLPSGASSENNIAEDGDEITDAAFISRTTRQTDQGVEHTVIRSIKSLAEKLGKTPTDVWTNPQLLENFSLGDPICLSQDAHERLRVWLDNYQVRGSFDDRTLVAMYL